MANRFYDKEALKKENLNNLKNRFGISSKTYDDLISDNNIDMELLFLLLTKTNTFDIIENNDLNYDYGCKIHENTNQEILNALYYDREYYPDEVVFVTDDKNTADIANLYFGEDSIKIIN